MITDRNHLLIGADTGGTFTDLVACDSDGRIVRSTKVSTTPHDPSEGILEACRVVPAGSVSAFLHGTTTGTNALLERRGARTALLVTQGFRDILELARQDRPNLYDWFQTKPEALVPRDLCFEVTERISPAGGSDVPLDEERARASIAELGALEVESVAISLLHAYADDAHERRLAELVREALPDVNVSLSSVVLPEIMEYERTSTTVANAYLAPVMERYLNRLLLGLRAAELDVPAFVMKSDGGLGAAETMANRAVQTILSGPAAGVIGGLASTAGSTKDNFLTIDMGGTSFDIAYAEQRKAAIFRESRIDDLPIAVPALEIHTLGAGGGSIAWIDAGGALRVGPQSAGSQPGPACYGRGGELPTVTDANAVLGRLGESLLGGRLSLDVDAAHRAVERSVALPLGITIVEAARGIIDVVNAAMAKGMHLMSVARGRDPRTLSVVGFGGAGPLHACELAAGIGSDEVVIPLLPGNTSALGLTLANVRRERSQAVLMPLASVGAREVVNVLTSLAENVAEGLREDGLQDDAITLEAVARVSYEGQRYQLDVPLPTLAPWGIGEEFPGSLAPVADEFARRHRAAYGYTREEPLALFALVVVGVGTLGRVRTPVADGVLEAATSSARSRSVLFGDRFVETPILERGGLEVAERFVGPAVVEQFDSTTIVPPGWSGLVDRDRNLILARSA